MIASTGRAVGNDFWIFQVTSEIYVHFLVLKSVTWQRHLPAGIDVAGARNFRESCDSPRELG